MKQLLNNKELKMKISWRGKGLNEKGYDENNRVVIECSKKYFRPSEVETLLGNPLKAKKILKWKPKISIRELVREMVQTDYRKFLNDKKKAQTKGVQIISKRHSAQKTLYTYSKF